MNRTVFHVAIFVVLFAAVAMAGRAQQTASPPDILSALLIEVRGLRAALEQMATAGPRVQLALGRVQLIVIAHRRDLVPLSRPGDQAVFLH